MPIDRGYEDDDVESDEGSGRRFQDFDCPDCAANNPYDDGFGDGDEVRCFYCGQDFSVVVTEAGRLRLKSL
ncbi:hypothetical protein [Anaeromyxobacter dehalogenans]|uniref:hypothetical protein n=1 Tax=Anaeromyxobacter dehalogenans TaxID=161493 RepID=UPI0003118D6F|nr:hypothetical protein [Anaeromyxobacter dehalogenans]